MAKAYHQESLLVGTIGHHWYRKLYKEVIIIITMINENKKELYKERILDVLKIKGEQLKGYLSHLTKLHLYDLDDLLLELLTEKKVARRYEGQRTYYYAVELVEVEQ